MTNPYIFISHSSKDNAAVAEIVDDLQANGVQVWVDFDRLESGTQWLNTIQDAIDDCAGFLVVMSKVSRRADWVMRECLYALQLRKPLYIALIDDVPLPLLLVDRQFTTFLNDYDEAIAILAIALRVSLDNPPQKTSPQDLPDTVSIDPNEHNFFTYLEQFEEGDSFAVVARDLYRWSQHIVHETEFSGRFRPALHGRVAIADKTVTVFSVLAYLRHPSVQIPFDYLSKYAPFTSKSKRRDILKQLETLLPKDEGFEAERIDRRPTVPLQYLLGNAQRLEKFKLIVADIVAELVEE